MWGRLYRYGIKYSKIQAQRLPLSFCVTAEKKGHNLSFSGRKVLRQSLFILTYIGRVIKSEVNAPAPLSKCHGIISILCCSSAELLWCPPSPLKLHRGPAHFPGPFPFGNWLPLLYLLSLSLFVFGWVQPYRSEMRGKLEQGQRRNTDDVSVVPTWEYSPPQ